MKIYWGGLKPYYATLITYSLKEIVVIIHWAVIKMRLKGLFTAEKPLGSTILHLETTSMLYPVPPDSRSSLLFPVNTSSCPLLASPLPSPPLSSPPCTPLCTCPEKVRASCIFSHSILPWDNKLTTLSCSVTVDTFPQSCSIITSYIMLIIIICRHHYSTNALNNVIIEVAAAKRGVAKKRIYWITRTNIMISVGKCWPTEYSQCTNLHCQSTSQWKLL